LQVETSGVYHTKAGIIRIGKNGWQWGERKMNTGVGGGSSFKDRGLNLQKEGGPPSTKRLGITELSKGGREHGETIQKTLECDKHMKA